MSTGRFFLDYPKHTKCDANYDTHTQRLKIVWHATDDDSIPEFFPSHAEPPQNGRYRPRAGVVFVSRRWKKTFKVLLEVTATGRLVIPSRPYQWTISHTVLAEEIKTEQGGWGSIYRFAPAGMIESVAADGEREITLVVCEQMEESVSDSTKYMWVDPDAITPEQKERMTPETYDFLFCSALRYYVRTRHWYS